MGTILLSAIVAHTSWHWMIDRATVLSQYQFQWSALTIASALKAVRLSLVVVVAAAVVWVISMAVQRKQQSYRVEL